MKKQILYIDMDNVLVDFTTTFSKNQDKGQENHEGHLS